MTSYQPLARITSSSRLPEIVARRVEEHGLLPNVWLGTSIENDRWVGRADHLRATPAAVRFISAEPLLAPLPSLDLTDIDWLIVGGESGSDHRPVNEQWVLDLRDRASEARSPTTSMGRFIHDVLDHHPNGRYEG